LPAAERALKDALDLARKMGNIHILSAASGHLAKIHRIHGDLQRARQVCEQGIRDLQE
ncbi:MAG: hypothetical protein GTO43_00930, partial [Armatimonadetes bacterium]|nr:hypothetical protein [Armatimonadota bacterium]NIN04947.1 hypothetical protein [Armatimonadota bacterium]NIT30277.1 hypothetical protein [Armatimonadota bacterium]